MIGDVGRGPFTLWEHGGGIVGWKQEKKHLSCSGLEGDLSFCRDITRKRIVSISAIAAIFLQEGAQQHASSYCRRSGRKRVILWGRDGGWLYSK